MRMLDQTFAGETASLLVWSNHARSARVFSGASDSAFINRSACSLLARANGATTRFAAQLDSRPSITATRTASGSPASIAVAG